MASLTKAESKDLVATNGFKVGTAISDGSHDRSKKDSGCTAGQRLELLTRGSGNQTKRVVLVNMCLEMAASILGTITTTGRTELAR